MYGKKQNKGEIYMIGAKVWRERAMKEREKNKLLQQEIRRRKREALKELDETKEKIKDIMYLENIK